MQRHGEEAGIDINDPGDSLSSLCTLYHFITTVIDEDYGSPSTVAAVFSSGSGLTSCAQVAIVNDDPYEGPETFTGEIVGSTVGMLAIGEPNITTVQIFDREGTYDIVSA